MSRQILAAILGVLLVSGCAMKQKKVMHTLENPAPVNCATAEGDLLPRCQVLARKHQHRVLVEGRLDLLPLAGLERGEAHVGHDRAERRVAGLGSRGHGASCATAGSIPRRGFGAQGLRRLACSALV